MVDTKERFLTAWSHLPGRDPGFDALLEQVESYLGKSSPQYYEMSDGQRLVITWAGLQDERGGVRDDGLRIEFERQRRHAGLGVWKAIGPSLIAELHSTSTAAAWVSGAIDGAILRHGAWQIVLGCVRGKWEVEGYGELTESVFYETLIELLRLEERAK